MLNSKIIITVILLLSTASSLIYTNSYKYQLVQTEKYQLKIQPQKPVRVQFIQYQGSAHLIIRSNTQVLLNTSSSFHQYTLTDSLIKSLIQITVTGSNAIGLIDCKPVEQFQMLKIGEEKLFHLRQKEIRIVEIHPRQLSELLIQKIEGVAVFTNNRCKLFEKIDCFNQLQRIDSITMSKTIEIVQLQYCSSCIILMKIQSESQQSKVRLSINSSIAVLNSHPTFSLIKQNQIQTFIVYGEQNRRGKIINFAGSVSIVSDLTISSFTNGLFYQLDSTHIISDAYELKVKGLEKINYFSVEAPLDERIISLRDGCPSTIKLEPGITYTLLFQHLQQGIGNFLVSGQSSLMNRLLMHFTNKHTNQNYTVRPRFLFDIVHGSQNFQLDNTTGIVQVQIKIIQGYGGYVNISAQVNQALNLPFDWIQASILKFNESDRYAMNGISGPVQFIISKCVECNIQLKIWSVNDEIKTEQINQRQTRIPYYPKNGQIFIQITTNNYGFYSIVMTKKKNNRQIPRLPNTNISVYLTEPDSYLELQFEPPICGSIQCQSPKYYLIQGSDSRHVATRSFCPNILFDFDQRTKDVIFQHIQPKRINENHISYIRPFKHRDWLVIVTEVNNQILSYDLVNSGQVRMYNNLRWPIFYLVLFITMAVFLSFVLFMGLRKKKIEDTSGYIRGASPASTQELN